MRNHWIGKGLIVSLAGLAGLFVFFRQFILSGGRWIVGDPADGRLILALHEHWFRFLAGKEGWFELGFFYPQENVLGYSDTFLLGGMIHSLFRLAGLDLFLAFQFTQMTVALAGFAGMYLWLHRYRGIGFGFSLFGAFLLLIASPVFLTSRNTHIQMQAVWLMPWIAILLEQAWRHLHSRPKGLLLSFTGLCFLYGLIAYSTFYIAWFCLLFLVVWLISALVLLGSGIIRQKALLVLVNWRYLLAGVSAASAWLGLFLATYLPARIEQGGRTLGEAIKSLPQPWDFINHSGTNLLWGKINNHLHAYDAFRWWELELGPTPLLCALILGSSLVLIRNWKACKKDGRVFYLITGTALVISFIMMVRIGLLSLWVFPYYLIPGGDGIRVGIRFMVLLIVPAVPVIIWGLQAMERRLQGTAGRALVTVLALFVLAEQVQLVSAARIDRIEQLQTLAQLPDPPEDATAFIPVTWKSQAHQTDAIQAGVILYAQHWDLPVCGGRSGFPPPGWTLSELIPPQVYANAFHWAEFKSIQGKLYFFNVDNSTWGRELPPIGERNDLFWLETQAKSDLIWKELTQTGSPLFDGLALSGWGDPENWGVWSISKKAEILVPQFDKTLYPLNLNLEFGVFIVPEHPSQRVRILLDGEEVYNSVVTEEGYPVSLSVEIKETNRSLTIEAPDAVSPISLGVSRDPRQLGVSISRLYFSRP